jgi:hypothetical protein
VDAFQLLEDSLISFIEKGFEDVDFSEFELTWIPAERLKILSLLAWVGDEGVVEAVDEAAEVGDLEEGGVEGVGAAGDVGPDMLALFSRGVEPQGGLCDSLKAGGEIVNIHLAAIDIYVSDLFFDKISHNF